jgi:hypothetical protein
MPVTRLRQLAPLIQAVGRKISAELGYQPATSLSPMKVEKRNGKRGGHLAKIAV